MLYTKNLNNMKQKFYTLLLTAVFGLTGMNAWAQLTQVDGVYQIGTAQDLVDFAAVVNGGEYTASAVLTADIDMDGVDWPNSIGDWQSSHMFKGKFDGQGHSITNLTFSTVRDYHGLFGVVGENAEIKNFTIEGNITVSKNSIGVIGYTRDNNVVISNIHSKLNFSGASGKRVGGIVGNANLANNVGTATIDRCTYSGTLSVSGTGNYGGIVGYVNNNSNVKTTITNCLFDGKITNSGGAAECGGIAGYVGANLTKVTIKNCLSIGTVSATVSGQFYGAVKNQANSIINCYYQGDAINGSGSSGSVTPTTQEATAVTDAQLASGEVAFLLNENVSGGENWFQKLKTKTFIAEQYVVTANGTTETPTTADITLSDAGDGTFTFTLPNFVLKIIGQTLPIGTISLTGVEIKNDGTFTQSGYYDVPDENIPSTLIAYSSYFKNIPYTLDGKVNNGNDKFYAEVDLTVMGNTVNVVAGEDNFTAAAPTGEAYPKPFGTAKVYANGSFNCDMTPKEGVEVTYANTDNSIVDSHSFNEGICSVCGAIDKTYMSPNADGYFEIANEKQLVWFAAYVNQESVAANAVLTDNITLTKAWGTPIGTGSGNAAPGATAYTGIFDGQGYSITGFNAEGAGHLGLFGDTSGATIKDFSISGNLTVTSGYGGGVVAWPINSTIEDVHSALTISVPNSSTHHVGGVVGSARGNNTITGCTFTGSLTVATGSTDNFAGIAAYITNGDKVTNCGNYGNITFSDASCAAGGLVGYLNSTSAIIENCLSVGMVTFNGEGSIKYGGAILGRTKNTNFTKITNNYWLEGSAYGSSKNDSGVDALAAESSTAAQLASGEVGFNLGDAWSQFLGTDTYPKPGVTCPVFYVGAAGYATLFDNNNDWALNGDAQAFIGAANGEYIHLTAIDDIPMSTAVVIKGTYYNKLATTATSDVSANEFLGTEEDTPADGTMYVLAKPEGMEIGFYLVEINSTIPAGKAYYQSTSGVKGFTFADDATGISDVNANINANERIFNLAGQRLSKIQKGINIVGSKKVLY